MSTNSLRAHRLAERVAVAVRLRVIDRHRLIDGRPRRTDGKLGMPRANAAVTASRQALVWSSM